MAGKVTLSDRRQEVTCGWYLEVIGLAGASRVYRSSWHWELVDVCLPLVERIVAAMPLD